MRIVVREVICALALTAFAAVAGATPLTQALDVQGQGLTVVQGGVGLVGLGAGSADITVNIGGTVQTAWLYWAGRDMPCPENPPGTCSIPSTPYKDQVLKFEGTTITGTIIGTEQQPPASGSRNNIGYFADVTTLVQAAGTGVKSFTIEDGNTSSNLARLDGASLIVIYTDAAATATFRIIIFQGLDFAYGADPTPGDPRTTAAITINHGTALAPRSAELYLFVGDGESSRPDRNQQ
jgi:hypothetical protein